MVERMVIIFFRKKSIIHRESIPQEQTNKSVLLWGPQDACQKMSGGCWVFWWPLTFSSTMTSHLLTKQLLSGAVWSIITCWSYYTLLYSPDLALLQVYLPSSQWSSIQETTFYYSRIANCFGCSTRSRIPEIFT